MTESKYSANFKLFNMDGLQVQFTVREDDSYKHVNALVEYINTLRDLGYRTTEPMVGAGEKVLKVTGWVLGEHKDKKESKFFPCVYLFSERGDYKQVTVYHERLNELPIEWASAQRWLGAAPMRGEAEDRGLMNKANFDVTLDVVLDADGNPKTSVKGNVVYKLGQVKGATPTVNRSEPEPTDEQPEEGGSTAEDNPFNETVPLVVRDWVAKGKGAAAAAIAWAVEMKAQPNDSAAKNSLREIVTNQYGGQFDTGNVDDVLATFYFRQQEHLNTDGIQVGKEKALAF